MNRYEGNVSSCKIPATMSKKPLTPSVEQTFTFVVLLCDMVGPSYKEKEMLISGEGEKGEKNKKTKKQTVHRKSQLTSE